MSGTVRSLRDWLADQLAEVRHLTPLAVLAPAKPTPIAVPDLADMPSAEIEPCCESEGLDTRWPACDGAPIVVAKLAHTQPRCQPTAYLLCGDCLHILVNGLKGTAFPFGHSVCGRIIDSADDLVLKVTPL